MTLYIHAQSTRADAPQPALSSNKCLETGDSPTLDQRVDVALPLICLSDKQVGDMPSDVVLVADSVAAEDLLQAVQQSVPFTSIMVS